MTELMMQTICARLVGVGDSQFIGSLYCPLYNDAQALELVKTLKLDIAWIAKVDGRDAGWWRVDAPNPSAVTARCADLNYAIVRCVAAMWPIDEALLA